MVDESEERDPREPTAFLGRFPMVPFNALKRVDLNAAPNVDWEWQGFIIGRNKMNPEPETDETESEEFIIDNQSPDAND